MKRRGWPRWDGERVRALRQHLGLTQEGMAEELGTRQQTISDWERDYYRPRGTSSTLLSIVAERVRFRYGLGLKLELGDITHVEAEAIVNAANSHLWMGGGVAGAIKRQAGGKVEREAVALGPIEPGQAVATSAGKLKARYIIHAATMGPDMMTDADKIRQATRSALAKAGELEVKSMAFPALGAGVGRFPIDQVAQLMVLEVRDYLQKHPGLSVVFVLHDQRAYEAFSREAG